MKQNQQLGVAFLVMVPVALVMAEVFAAMIFFFVGFQALREKEQ